MKKTILTMALLLMTIVASAAVPEIFSPRSAGRTLMVVGVADNGQWAVAQTPPDDTQGSLNPPSGTIYNIATRTSTEVTSPSGYVVVNDITDGGVAAGAEDGVPAVFDPQTRQWQRMPLPAGYDNGALLAITPDGRWAVGYVAKGMMEYYPALYDVEAAAMVQLTGITTKSKTGIDYHSAVFYSVSPDGRYIGCMVAQSVMMDELGAPIWGYVYDREVSDWRAIGFDVDREQWSFMPKVSGLSFVDSQWMSPNGEWITGSAWMAKPIPGSEFNDDYVVTYRYNVLSDTFELYDQAEDRDYAGSRVLNDGTVLAHSPAQYTYPSAWVRSGNYFVSFDDILGKVYDTKLEHHIGDDVTGACNGVSADGMTLAMRTIDNCYIMRLSEPIAEVAQRVDLLADYVPSVPDGSAISKLKSIQLTFARPISVHGDPQSIRVVDEQGNTLWQSLQGTGVHSDNNRMLNVGLRTVTLAPGKAYTVVIPAGFVCLAGDANVQSHEIRITYYGRSADAVSPVAISPAAGTSVSVLDQDASPVVIDFDTDIVPNETFGARLIASGESTPQAVLMGYCHGRQLVLYPAAPQHLYQGTDYEVQIDAGSVTDLTGSGPNEAITVLYHGAYERHVSADDKYIFSEDMSNYGENLIFWQTEWNEPASIPASWGFTADNPWYPVRDSSADTEQAMAAHSMFKVPAKADDWMMTPQLYIPDERCYLTFQAQSYLYDKCDVLRVWVYPTDRVINSVNYDMVAELTASIRSEGELVFEQQLLPGSFEETLAGDWVDYTVDLSAYAGRSIYIAFNNNNEDQSAVFVNRVQVVRNISFLTTLYTPESVVARESVAVRGVIMVDDDLHTYSTLQMSLIADGEVLETLSAAGLALAKGDRYEFAFGRELPLRHGDVTHYSIDIMLDDEHQVVQQSIKNLAFEPVHRVVLEEIAGSTCSNCPLGILAVERLQSLYPNNFIAVTIRAFGGDVLGTGVQGYAQFLGFSAAPKGRIDRGEILSPMVSNAGDYTYTGAGLIDSETGREVVTWSDAVAERLQVPADGDIEFEVQYDAATRHLVVPCEVRYAMNARGANIGLLAVVLEDGLFCRQENGMGSVSDPDLGQWGLGGALSGAKVPYYANDVARLAIGASYNGTVLAVNDFVAGQTYTHTIEATVPEGRLADPTKCRVVVMMIDGVTQRVINANVAHFWGSTLGMEHVVAAGDISISTGDDGDVTVRAQQAVTACVVTPAGALVAAGSSDDGHLHLTTGYRGVAIVKASTADSTVARKVVLK